MANPSLHYLGGGNLAPTGDHQQCLNLWASIIRQHSGYRPPPAYNFALCNAHGTRMDGRGWQMDSAANGSDADPENENLGSRALVCLMGSLDVPTLQLKQGVAAFRHRDAYALRLMSWPLRPHSDYVSTQCCGDALRQVVYEVNVGLIKPPGQEEDDDVKNAYISCQSNPGLGIYVTNWIHKRWVTPAEWRTVGFLGGGTYPQVVGLNDEFWNSIPIAK